MNLSITTLPPAPVTCHQMAAQSAVEALLADGGILTFGVCGLGGTGKSTLCRALAKHYAPNVLLVETDWYLTLSSSARKSAVLTALQRRDVADIERWSDPSAWYDWDAFICDLDHLRTAGELHLNAAWRQSTGEKDLTVNLRVSNPSRTVLVFDGIYLLHPPIRGLLDQVMLLEDSAEAARVRAEGRDAHRVESAYLQFKADVARSFDVPYFERLSASADIRVPAMHKTTICGT